MKKYFKYIAIFTLALLFNCETDEGIKSELSSFVGFENKTNIYVTENATESFDISVAASEVSSSDRTYSISVVEDDTNLTSAYSVPTQVTIPANSNVGSFTVEITDDSTLNFAPQNLVIAFDQVVGLDFSDNLEIDVTQKCDFNLVDLVITTDDYASETQWQLYRIVNGTPTQIESGGPYTSAENNSDILNQFCLESGDYAVVLYDTYGDGGSSYVMSLDGTELASGSTPDAGAYPTTTNTVGYFTLD
ncbi:MAG: hypothetical protein ACPGUH_00380 [Winogradskyella sp.]